MSWLSIFNRSPSKQIERLRKKVREPHGDPATRINAAQRLLEMGTPESYLALLERFKIHVSPSRQDEEEKEELLGWIVGVGEAIVPAAIRFLKRERQVYWPAEALKRILPEAELNARLVELLRHHWENPPASPDPKAQLIRAVGDLRSSELDEAIRLFLEDDDDDVLLAALDYCFSREEEDQREAILSCYLESQDRPRVRAWTLERLVEKGWTVRGFRPKIEETLPENYKITRDGVVKRVSHIA